MRATYPDIEVEVLVCDGLDVEADGGDGGDDLANLGYVSGNVPVSTPVVLRRIERTLSR